jgi:hypothetical protein
MAYTLYNFLSVCDSPHAAAIGYKDNPKHGVLLCKVPEQPYKGHERLYQGYKERLGSVFLI